jgi:glycosyltransferase involved in cell wall biosynthesis
MKVLIVNNMAPFVWGGAEELAVNLQKNLILSGHEAEILRIPFQWEPATRIPSQMMMARAFELDNVDKVIALKFPAYLIRHPNKSLWLLHQYRQAYDLFDVGQTNLPEGELGNDIRNLIRNADDETFSESRKIFTNSIVTQQRLMKYNGFASEILLPPINDPEIFHSSGTGDYVFAGGRINDMKRQHVLIEAMKYATRDVKLVVAGPPDTPADGAKLERMVEQSGLGDRIRLDLRMLPRSTYADYVRNSLAVAYMPFDEDSLGYVTMEGALAGKALITTSDSGGVTGLVIPELTGWIAEPSPASLGEVLSMACENPTRSKVFGAAAREYWNSLGIDWPATVASLMR